PMHFENRPGTLGPAWPIELQDIAPHYSTACRYANCGEPVFEAPIKGVSVKDGRFTHNTIERWSHKPKFQQAHRATLIAHPNVTVCLHATVVDLEFARGDRNRVCAVIVADADGRRIGLVVKNLILAAGGVETTRLLL